MSPSHPNEVYVPINLSQDGNAIDGASTVHLRFALVAILRHYESIQKLKKDKVSIGYRYDTKSIELDAA
ncbi:hypothetical protein Ancab_039230 [Ancistrocladus abbreviatus]